MDLFWINGNCEDRKQLHICRIDRGLSEVNKRKVMAKLLAFGKKNRFSKILSIISLSVYLSFYYLVAYLRGNVRRYACLVCVVFFFFSCTSFSYVDLVQNEGSDAYVAEQDYVNEIGETIQTEILDDKDVLEGYENAELEYVDESDQYSMEEILEENDNSKYLANDLGTSTGGKLSKDDWNLILINKHHSIPEGYEVPLGKINASMQCDERIIPDLLEMLQAAKNDGVSLIICSPYRDINRQKVLFERKIKKYMKQGMSYLEAYQLSSQTVTVPGASEHQIGLAIDFLTDNHSSLNEEFGNTAAGKWLAVHGYEYGFILRYPKDKEYITGIGFEPWHYRYVGKEAAARIQEQNLTLEEFLDTLEN